MTPHDAQPDEDDPEHALREIRGRFVAGFAAQCGSIAALVADAAEPDGDPRKAGLLQLVHRLTGLAGTIGFPTVSRRAGELESLLLEAAPDVAFARLLMTGVQEAFASDLRAPPPWAAAANTGQSSRVLIVEDDVDQMDVLVLHLRGAGHQTKSIVGGDAVLEAVRQWHPDVVLLDVDLPGLDGYTVCRLLKSDPDLAATPVVFLTTRATLNERLAGLTLGADEYLCKPIDPRELLLRVSRAVRPGQSEVKEVSAHAAVLTFEAFAGVAAAQLAEGGSGLALLRVPAGESTRAAQVLSDEGRRRDVIGCYDRAHLIWLLPGLGATAALERAMDAVERMRSAGIKGTAAGVAAIGAGGTLEALVAEADEALADARSLGEPAALKNRRAGAVASPVARTIVIADDDADVIRIVDSHMRAAGFRTVLAFDGADALRAVEEHQPDALVLDLMMPGMTGFDVLSRLQKSPVRPKTLVLSARGREDDVTRAFGLGADDYIVKPFSPQELRARVERLLR